MYWLRAIIQKVTIVTLSNIETVIGRLHSSQQLHTASQEAVIESKE